MGFVFSKGYLVHNDLPWGADEFLRGSECVNDVVQWRAADATGYAAFATNSDLVVIRPDVNAYVGHARLFGGFEKVARAGDHLYAIAKAAPSRVYRLDWTAMAGDSTPADWTPFREFTGWAPTDVHGMTYDGRALLAICGSDGAKGRLWIVDPATGAEFVRDTAASGSAGFFPKGDWNNALFHARGACVYALYDPHLVNADQFPFHLSVGAMADDFAGPSLDPDRWRLSASPGTGVVVDGGLRVTLPSDGGRSASLLGEWFCPGDVGVRARFDVESAPEPAGDEVVYWGVGLVSADGRTRLMHAQARGAEGSLNRLEVYRDDALVHETELAEYTGRPYIAVDRYEESGAVRVRVSCSSAPPTWETMHVWDDPTGDMGTLVPMIFAGSTVVASMTPTTVRVSEFAAREKSGAIYRTPTPGQLSGLSTRALSAAGVSAKSDGEVRQIVLAYDDHRVQVARVDMSDRGGASESRAVVSPSVGATGSVADLELLGPTRNVHGVASTDDRLGAFVAGSDGVFHLDTSASSLQTLALHRRYTTAYDHAQPLVDESVRCLDFRGLGFVYGCRSEPGPYGDDWGYGYGFAGADDGGGAGYVVPDFDAPVGADAWAEARPTIDGAQIRAGFRMPSPPPDFLHAHWERRINGGAWHRLTHDGWRALATPWDHGRDVAFPPVADRTGALADARAAAQDVVEADGRYEYRWAFHDEAGNEGTLTCVTGYGDDAEYVDTPTAAALVLNDGAARTSDRGVTARFAGRSGAASGDREGRVRQVRLWCAGTPESDAAWCDYPPGASSALFDVTLPQTPGLVTVRARARHRCGRESEPIDATIENEGLSVVLTPRDNVTIAHGAEGAFNFSSDAGVISASSEDAAFVVANVKQHDLSAPWRSHGLGVATYGYSGGVRYAADITVDLLAARRIEVAAILGHNFDAMAAIRDATDFSVVLTGADDAAFEDPGAFACDLTQLRAQPIVAHRPRRSHRYWRLRMEIAFPHPSSVPLGAPSWSIGRLILNESSLCFTPAFNHDEGMSVEWTDPSATTETLGQARRVVERQPYRRLELTFRDLEPAQAAPFETVWRRQRLVRPVLVLLNPGDIAKGDETPRPSGVEDGCRRGVVYGYLGDRLRVEGSGWNHVNVRLTVDEIAG